MKFIYAFEIINQLSRDLNYSRAHVANTLRKNAVRLHAQKAGRFWRLTPDAAAKLAHILRTESGPRYKLREKGSRR